ncbi:MAG TPA: hypothetical protein VHA11_07190 [Bryobacteraceae bacterium]|nr:hypothetical protein [Bryobacteraceae bacterium]
MRGLRLLMCALAMAACGAAAGPDVLIVYDGGPVYKTVAPAADDAVAGASAAVVNCRTVAERLGAELEARKLRVRLAAAADIHDRRELLAAPLLVLGSPVRFSNVSWEMKRLFDEHLYRIRATAPPELAKHRIAGFAVGEVEPAARATLEAMRAAVEDCGGKLEQTRVLLSGTSRVEAARDIREFAAALTAAAR